MLRPLICALSALTGAAQAQVTPIGPFSGPHPEGFETQPAAQDTLYTCLPGRVFGGTADLCDPATDSLIVPSFWSLFCQATPRTGARYVVGLEGPLEIAFDTPVKRVGGYFATVGGVDGGVATFFDASGAVGSADLSTSQCDWQWSGWESSVPFTRVRIAGNSPFGDGGYLHMDDLEYEPVSAPCYANCDASTASPVLNANDFQCFLNRFAAADSYANCDGSSASPILNANDFQCFLNSYSTGCQ